MRGHTQGFGLCVLNQQKHHTIGTDLTHECQASVVCFIWNVTFPKLHNCLCPCGKDGYVCLCLCREFELPWFDVDAREAKETVRTTRSKARASTSRLSVGSSGESRLTGHLVGLIGMAQSILS